MKFSAVASCCSQLAAHFGSKVLFPDTAAYEAVESSYWSLQEASLTPKCIVTPATAADVSDAVTIMTGVKGCDFAIKGRTHAPAAGFANIDDGVTIDMTGLSTLSLNEDKSVLSVGAGAQWLDVYAYLDPFDLAVAGGRNGLVGVGGLTLGGGISHFTARVGFACDNAVNFEVVLASGEIVNANASSHRDLFRALKGGANNFGVVTRFDLATFQQGQISVTKIVNSIDDRKDIFKAFTDITNAPKFDPDVSLVTGLLFNSTSKAWALTNSAVYTKAVKAPKAFKELKKVPSISTSNELTRLSIYANESATPPLNWLFWTGTYATSSSFLEQTFDILNDTLFDFDVPGGVVWSIALEPLPTLISTYAEKGGGNSLGLSPQDGNAYVVLVSPLWPNSASNEAVQHIAQQLGSRIDKKAASQNLLHKFRYVNYASPSQDPFRGYGPENLAKLRSSSKKYDPSGVFQKRVPGGFKLF